MRALTLTQPWAGLVAAGIKLIENRSRAMIKLTDFGAQFAIHASRQIDGSIYDQIARIDPRHDVHQIAADTPWLRLSHVTSAVIGVATVESVVHRVERVGEPYVAVAGGGVVDLGEQRKWFFGPFGYVLRDVRALAEPVPCRGWYGFWRLPADVEADVLRQVRCMP
jgi:hypothetical protein